MLQFSPHSMLPTHPVIEVSYSSTSFISSTKTSSNSSMLQFIPHSMLPTHPVIEVSYSSTIVISSTKTFSNSSTLQFSPHSMLPTHSVIEVSYSSTFFSSSTTPLQTHPCYNSLHIQCYQLAPLLEYRTPARFSAPLPHLFKLIHVTIHSTFNVTNSRRC